MWSVVAISFGGDIWTIVRGRLLPTEETSRRLTESQLRAVTKHVRPATLIMALFVSRRIDCQILYALELELSRRSVERLLVGRLMSN